MLKVINQPERGWNSCLCSIPHVHSQEAMLCTECRYHYPVNTKSINLQYIIFVNVLGQWVEHWRRLDKVASIAHKNLKNGDLHTIQIMNFLWQATIGIFSWFTVLYLTTECLHQRVRNLHLVSDRNVLLLNFSMQQCEAWLPLT